MDIHLKENKQWIYLDRDKLSWQQNCWEFRHCNAHLLHRVEASHSAFFDYWSVSWNCKSGFLVFGDGMFNDLLARCMLQFIVSRKFRPLLFSTPYQLENIKIGPTQSLFLIRREMPGQLTDSLCVELYKYSREKRKDDLLVLRIVARPVAVRGICSGNLFSFVYEAFKRSQNFQAHCSFFAQLQMTQELLFSQEPLFSKLFK